MEPDGSPFTPMYVLDDEYAAEIANRTMHGVAHLGWAPDDTGAATAPSWPRSSSPIDASAPLHGLIRPFRYMFVYPALMRTIGRAWRQGAAADLVGDRSPVI